MNFSHHKSVLVGLHIIRTKRTVPVQLIIIIILREIFSLELMKLVIFHSRRTEVMHKSWNKRNYKNLQGYPYSWKTKRINRWFHLCFSRKGISQCQMLCNYYQSKLVQQIYLQRGPFQYKLLQPGKKKGCNYYLLARKVLAGTDQFQVCLIKCGIN